MRRVREDAELLKYLPYILGIIIIGGAILIATGVVKTDLLKGACLTCGGEGFTINSISATQIISNNADLASANMIVSLAANGGGQSLVGTIDGRDLASKFTSNPIMLALQYPLKVDMSAIDEKMIFNIENQGMLIQSYSLKEYPQPNWWTAADCNKNEPGFQMCFYDNSFILFPRAFALIKTPVTNLGLISNPNIVWSGKITMTMSGIPYTKTIGSGVDGTSGSVEFNDITGNWIGRAQWTSSGVTGQATPNQNNYRAIYSYGRWNIVDWATYDAYDKTLTLDRFLAIKTSISGNRYCTDTTCSNVRVAMQPNLDATKKLMDTNVPLSYTSLTGRAMTYTASGTQTTGQIIATGDRITVPTIILTLKATALGIYIPVGKPQIIKPIPAITFNSGDANAELRIGVKNIGEAKGTFVATLTDPSGTFTSLTSTAVGQISLNPAETGTIVLKIGHGTSGTADKTVTVTVYDINFANIKDTADVKITMTGPKKCAPGVTRIDDNLKIVWKCNPDGMGETRILDCQIGGVIKVGNEYKCSTSGEGGTNGTGGGSTDDSKVLNAEKLNWYDTTSAKVLVGLIVLLVILLVWRKQNE